jgi:hypothetical protein
MGDLMVELKELRLHGMACAWEELVSQGDAATASSKWLLEHLLQQEHVDRAVRSVNHQMNMAKLPMHRDLAGFDFSQRRRPLGQGSVQTGVHRYRAEYRVHRRAWNRQDPPGHRLGRVRDHDA